jgi:hypothetical protein
MPRFSASALLILAISIEYCASWQRAGDEEQVCIYVNARKNAALIDLSGT